MKKKIVIFLILIIIMILGVVIFFSINKTDNNIEKNEIGNKKLLSETENSTLNKNKKHDTIEYIGKDGTLGVTIYKENDKTDFELVNFNGKTICNFKEMEYNQDINNNLILINKDDLYKVIDTKGNIIFEEISISKPEIISHNNQDKFITFKKNEKVKIINIETQEIISNYEYEDVSDSCITNELIKVKKNGKYGCIDKNGNIIIDFEYEDLCGYYFLENMIVAKKDGKYGYLDNNGNVIINLEYDRLGFFSEDVVSAKKGDKIGFLDKEENIIIDFQYDYIHDIEHFVHLSYLWDMPQFKEDVALVFKDEWSFYIDKAGNKVIDFETNGFNVIDEDFNNGFLIVEKNGKYGIFDKTGKLIVDFIYDEIQNYGTIELLPAKLNGKWGCIDKNGNVIINFEFNDSPNFDTNYDNIIDEYAIVRKNKKNGCIDKNGNILVEFKYDSLIKTANNNFLQARSNNKIGIINTKGEIIIDFEYDEFSFYNTEFLLERIVEEHLDENRNLLGTFRKGEIWETLDIEGNKIGTYKCKSK